MTHDYDDDAPSQEPLIPSGSLKLDEIQGETQTKWLWPDKVPIGHVTIVAGEASSGKSLLAAEIAARVSSGAGWPLNGTESVPYRTENGTKVLIAHANQHENLVLKGRLLAAGAKASRVTVMNRDAFDFEQDIGREEKSHAGPTLAETSLCVLEGALLEMRDVSLVVIDHLLGWLGRSRLRPDELTAVFKRLADMAAQYRVAVVVLWRLEKGGRAAQTRALDALAGAAPVVWLLANDAYSSQSRSAVCAQNRLGMPSDEMSFRVAGGRLVWQQASRHVSADDVLAGRTADRHERRQAGQWLLDLLSQGPLDAKQLWREARECGLAERTVRRAAAELDLRPTKDGKRNVWLWGASEPVPGAGGGAVQSVAVLPAIGSLADGALDDGGFRVQRSGFRKAVGSLSDGGMDNRDGCPTKVDSLADSAVVQVELRPDAPPSVAALPAVGSLADGALDNRDGCPTQVGSLAGDGLPEAPAGEQNVAVLPSVGSLAAADEVEHISPGEQNVTQPACSDERSEEEAEERKRLTEALAAAAATEGVKDRAKQSESPSARKRRLRDERRFIERTLRICRDG